MGNRGIGRLGKWGLVLLLAFVLSACAPAKKELRYEPFDRERFWQYREEGLASWYGEEYHGRKTANGEVYNMHAMTAAHRTLPFNTRVRVTNLENRKKADLRINDRGPFIPGRIIDLSKNGGQAIGILGTGTAKVVLEVTGFAGEGTPSLEGLYSIQVGAFGEKENALRLQNDLKKKYPNVHLVLWESNVKRFYRVRLGSFRNEAEARRYLPTLRQDNLSGFIVRED